MSPRPRVLRPSDDAPLTRIDRLLLEGLTEHVLDELRTERRRQIVEERWNDQRLVNPVAAPAAAAAAYCWHVAGHMAYRRVGLLASSLWPWHHPSGKPKDDHRDLVRAGALVVAALERLHRDAALPADVEAS